MKMDGLTWAVGEAGMYLSVEPLIVLGGMMLWIGRGVTGTKITKKVIWNLLHYYKREKFEQ